MAGLFDGTDGLEDIREIYARMEANCPDPWSNSKELWKLRCACKISPNNRSPETMLEKAAAMLSENGYMDEWFNQCPAASGITDSSRDRASRVDLVHWLPSKQRARLVELKWNSNDPPYALMQILRYGAAYIFCRVHREKLPLRGRPLMNARHVALEVAAPRHFYAGFDEMSRLARMRQSLDEFAAAGIDGLSMSLDALAFPEGFRLPFRNGRDVKQQCGTHRLTAESEYIRDAFANLTPVWPEP